MLTSLSGLLASHCGTKDHLGRGLSLWQMFREDWISVSKFCIVQNDAGGEMTFCYFSFVSSSARKGGKATYKEVGRKICQRSLPRDRPTKSQWCGFRPRWTEYHSQNQRQKLCFKQHLPTSCCWTSQLRRSAATFPATLQFFTADEYLAPDQDFISWGW